jgi:hypothetical protein
MAETFEAFFSRFRSDPQFQLDRIRFPLPYSYIDLGGSTHPEDPWPRDKWRIKDFRSRGDDLWDDPYRDTVDWKPASTSHTSSGSCVLAGSSWK